MSVTGDASMFNIAKMFVYGCADEFMDESAVSEEMMPEIMERIKSTNLSNMTFRNMIPEVIITEYMIRTANSDMNVLDCLSLIVAEYMSINNSQQPSRETMEKIFEILNTDDED